MSRARASLFDGPAPRVFSIDAGRPFARDLAAALRASCGDDPLALSAALIFVPTRRAVRVLMDAFVETAPAGRASLLPSIRALGDVDEDELALDAPEGLDDADLLPAISPLERRLALARLVAAAERAFSGQENWPAALAAAGELGRLLDSFHAEEIPLDRLKDAAPEAHAAHWARALDFLAIVSKAWPAHLAEQGLMDPAERRARLIALETGRLAAAAPAAPVIVAGTTGSAPAVARLMRTVAGLPRGAVVLPGLDAALAADAKAWDAVDDPHPQMGLKAALSEIGVAADAVSRLPGAAAPSPRSALLSLALRPADATDDWRERVNEATARDPAFAAARDGLALIEAESEEAEAGAVAILMREALETPGRTAMLVTPDRHLGRRVAAKMRRWGVSVDDSAGVPFANSPCGTFLRLVAGWLAAPSDPAALLSLARHPLAGFGLEGKARRAAAAAIDLALRGVAPGPGLDGLERKLAAGRDRWESAAAPLMAALKNAVARWPAGRAPFAAFLDAHLAAAEALAATDAEPGAARLWRGEDGETGAALLTSLRAMAAIAEPVEESDYPQGFMQLLAGASVRRRAPAHPRLSILGPLEARLVSADLVILGGLNEGVWPQDAAVDPFLSRDMRARVGLPSPERRQGLAAHDFAQLAAAPSVALTRARMTGGAPARPSRWIVRLKNILAGADALDAVDETARFSRWLIDLDRPGAVTPVGAPAPRPPLDARPRRLAVTRFEKLMRDPYGIYARHVLGLEALGDHGAPAGAADLGNLLHRTFERFVETGAGPDPAGARARLAALLAEEAAAYGLDGAMGAYWRTRLDAALDWFLAFDAERRAAGDPAVIEGKGERAFDVAGRPFTLYAYADRIDRLKDGRAHLIDYKSGGLPTLDQMKAAFKPQLPLTALIVEAGGFEALGPAAVAGFGYVKSLNRKGTADDYSGAEGADARAMIRQAREGFEKLVAHFDDPSTPYLSQPRPQYADDWGDYDRLARRREWAHERGDE